MIRRITDESLDAAVEASDAEGATLPLRAAVLLAGSVRTNRLHQSTGRNLVDLPVQPDQTVLDVWRGELLELAMCWRLPALPVRVMLGRTSSPVTLKGSPEPLIMRLEQDPFDYRGTGGLLSDLAREYGDDDYILVANAAQVLMRHITQVAETMAGHGADISLLADDRGTPGGVMLIRCGSLRTIKPIGYVDLKEQALPSIAKDFDVRVVRLDGVVGLPIRTRTHYLETLRAHHRQSSGVAVPTDAWPEDWQASFGLVEEGATVAESATIHDSVVLRGGVVEPDAVVVRSIVCEGGVVSRGASAMDRFVTANHMGD